jgi:hypothetical protein
MIAYKKLDKVQLPISRAYWTTVENLVPDSQAFLQNLEGYMAGKGRQYSPNVHLLTKDLVVTESLKQRLSGITRDDTPILVGDLMGEDCRIDPRHLNDLINHMEKRETKLNKRNIKISKDGRYPSLLKNRSFFQDTRTRNYLRPYSGKSDIHITVAVDGSVSKSLNRMHCATEIAEELFFQQHYFLRQDHLALISFGKQIKEVPHYRQAGNWMNPGGRNTAECLEHCVKNARNGYHHVYLIITGTAEDRVCDAAMELKKKGLGLTQFVVDDSKLSAGQALQTTQDSRGDVYFVKEKYVDLLSLMVNEHYETFRAGVKFGS